MSGRHIGEAIGGGVRHRKQLETDLAHITQEMYRRNKELADTNRTLSLLQSIDTIVLEPHTSMKQVCDDIAQAIAQATNYPFAGIWIRAQRDHDEFVIHGWSTGRNAATDALFGGTSLPRINLKHDVFLAEHNNQLFSLSDPSAQKVLLPEEGPEHGFMQLEQTLGLQSVYLAKLLVRHHLVGVLMIGFQSLDQELSSADATFLERITDSVGVALDNKLLFEENQHVLRELRVSNTKLRALDETKDDFISMASHQLRTPLTSVKGYLSMVLDGDAGQINPTQSKMLKQAFTSSQRMVFLITDLLNVSRLKTGKFVIDPVPTDLGAVVEEEVEQVVESAQAKHLELTITQPPGFPTLMLDVTKIRQVIMNFVDNAIYYTPEGGHIRVVISDGPDTIRLEVIDDGIGVLRAEQHRLFMKFYRATNARKARPDGTGLGLFMAAQVIAAHGGSLIFTSELHKGSTFGFSFPKSVVCPPDNQPVLVGI